MMDQSQDQALSLWVSSASFFSSSLHVTHDGLVTYQGLPVWISSASAFSNPLHVTHDGLVARSSPFALDQLC